MIVNGAYYNENPSGDWYSYDEIDKTGANYRIVIGMKSNGKTYGMKLKFLENFFKHGKQFAYLRTSVEEIKLKRVSGYWADMTDVLQEYGQHYFPGYDFYSIEIRNGRFILYGNTTDPVKAEKLGVMGYYFALNQTRYDSSIPYPDINIICYEEFLSTDYESPENFPQFIKFVSTIKRKRTDMVVYLLGNTVSRSSVILGGMGINVRELKQGTVQLFSYHWGDGANPNTVAIEWCRRYEQSTQSESFFHFGDPRELMITNGLWETGEYPIFNIEAAQENIVPKMALCFDVEGIHLYAYFMQEGALISDTRLLTYAEYWLVHEGATNLHRHQIAIDSPLQGMERLRKYIRHYYDNGWIKYSNNLAGDDFARIMQRI